MKIIDRKFLKVETNTCHASTVAFYQEKPVFAWFGGSVEGSPDCSIYVQYEDEIRVIKDAQIAHWNPILFTVEDELFLSYKIGRFCDCWSTIVARISNIKRFMNHGTMEKQILPAGLNFCTKTKPIIKNGLVHCGSSVETFMDWSGYDESYLYDKPSKSFIFASRTHPMTVDKVTYMDSYYNCKRTSTGIIQPSLYMDSIGNLHAFFRSSRGLGKIYYSFSEDEINELWSRPQPTKFPNPNSGMDCVYHNKRLFLVYNPSEQNRFPLIIQELDENTFSILDEIIITEKIPDNEITATRELSYPYLVENYGKLHLTYTWGRSKIEHVVIGV